MKFEGQLFRQYREMAGFTQKNIADRLGYSRQAVEKWENGKSNPKPDVVKKLAKMLNLSVIDISDLPPEPETLKHLNEVENDFLCKITGRKKCIFDGASSAKKFLLEEIEKLNDESIKEILKFIFELEEKNKKKGGKSSIAKKIEIA